MYTHTLYHIAIYCKLSFVLCGLISDHAPVKCLILVIRFKFKEHGQTLYTGE